MIWLSLAFKNILRRPVRSALTALGVAVGIAVLFSLLEFVRGYEHRLRHDVDALGAHIMVVPKGCPYEAATIVLHGGKWPRYMDEAYEETVRQVEGVRQHAAIIMDAIILGGGQQNNIYVGIDENYPRLRPRWEYQSGGWFRDENSIILGANTAATLGVRVGGTVTLYDPSRRSSGVPVGRQRIALTVSGILEPNATQDDGIYFLPRKTLQKLFGLEGKLVVILVKTDNPRKVDEVANRLRATEASMNVFPLAELLTFISSILRNTQVFVLAIVLAALAVGAVGVLNTILMAVFERTREIGMMKAVGASRSDVFRLIWLETIVLAFFGGVVGIVLSLFTSKGVEGFMRQVLPYVPSGSLIAFEPGLALLCLFFAVLIGVIAGTYPAHRAARVLPMEAIRTE